MRKDNGTIDAIYVLDLGTRVTSNPEHAGIYNGSVIATSPNNTFEGHLRSLMAFSQNSGGTIGVPKDPLDHAHNSGQRRRGNLRGKNGKTFSEQ